MVQLTLTAEEAAVLGDLLENDLSELCSEVVHTDSYDYRERLKSRAAILRRILEHLRRDAA